MEHHGWKLFYFVVTFIVFFGLLFGGFAITKSASADGRIDFCYTRWNATYGPIKGYFSLFGHIPWRSDIRIGEFVSNDEVLAAAKAHNCELH